MTRLELMAYAELIRAHRDVHIYNSEFPGDSSANNIEKAMRREIVRMSPIIDKALEANPEILKKA